MTRLWFVNKQYTGLPVRPGGSLLVLYPCISLLRVLNENFNPWNGLFGTFHLHFVHHIYMCICLSKMFRIFLFLHARGIFPSQIWRHEFQSGSTWKTPKFMMWTVKRIYSVCPIFTLACTISIYLLLVNTVWKACTNTVHLHVLWALADLTILIHVPGFKFVSEILICRSIKTSVSLYQRSGIK